MKRGQLLATFCLAALVCLAGSITTFAQDSSYSGRATGVVSVGPTSATAGDTCPLPEAGGTITMTTPSASLPGISTGTIISSTSGGGTSSQSSSTVSNLNLTAGDYNIRATSVGANTQCSCCPGSAEAICGGTTNISNLVITGPTGVVPVTITGLPNQIVNLGAAGTITINEQITGLNEITVNALHVNITSGGVTTNVLVASVHSDIVCGGGGPSPAEVTVSGRVQTAGGQPIGNATVTLISNTGTRRSAITTPSGTFSVASITAGQTYGVQTAHKSYNFAPQVITVVDEISNMVITASP